MKWQDVTGLSSYQKLNPQSQQKVKEQYYNSFIRTRSDFPTDPKLVSRIHDKFLGIEAPQHVSMLKGFADNLLAGASHESVGFWRAAASLFPTAMGSAIVNMQLDKVEKINKGVETRALTEPNVWKRTLLQFGESLGATPVDLMKAVMTGGASKAFLLPSLAPKLAVYLARVPDFVLGLTMQGLVKGAKEGTGFTGKVLGAAGRGADAFTWGLLYSGVGSRWMIPKMGALGAVNAGYEALKQKRKPTMSELAIGSGQGVAMALAFKILPMLAKGSKLVSESSAIRSHQREFHKAVQSGDLEWIKRVSSDIYRDPRIRPEIKEAVKMVSEPESYVESKFKPKAQMESYLDSLKQNAENIKDSKTPEGRKELKSVVKEIRRVKQAMEDPTTKALMGKAPIEPTPSKEGENEIVGYRFSKKRVGVAGTFYTLTPQERGGYKTTLKFKNLLEIPSKEITNSGLPSESLLRKFDISGKRVQDYASKHKIEEGLAIDKLVASEARKRGYDGIQYGNFQIQDLRSKVEQTKGIPENVSEKKAIRLKRAKGIVKAWEEGRIGVSKRSKLIYAKSKMLVQEAEGVTPPVVEKPNLSAEPKISKSARLQLIKDAHKKFLERKALKPTKPISPQEIIQDPTKASQVIGEPLDHPPESQKLAREMKSEPTPEFKTREIPEGDAETVYNVQYQTPAGPRETMMNGTQLKALQEVINKGVVGKDDTGTPILKINEALPFKGHKAQVPIPPIDDLVTDIIGASKLGKTFSMRMAKQFGTPFFIGEKYKLFKGVYMAIQDRGIDYKSELFYEGASVLNPLKMQELSESSKAKISDVLKLGHLEGRYYNSEELRGKYNLNKDEIEVYKNFERMYKYGLNLEIKSKIKSADYLGASADERKILMQSIREKLATRGGYVSQSRAQGKWAIYQGPLEKGGKARFFTMKDRYSEALKLKAELGEGAKVYAKNEFLERELYHHLTISDLENLVEASDVDTNSSVVNAMRKTLRKKTFESHWIQRKDIAGYEWNLDNLTKSALDYLDGVSSRLARTTGRSAAETSLRKNIKLMSPVLRSYAMSYIDGYYNTGSMGFKWFQRLAYAYKLSFKTSWLAQNLTQPLATTYPLLAKYYRGMDPEKVFLDSYKLAVRYAQYRLGKGKHGLSTPLAYILNKSHRQGVLGDQLTKFQLGVKAASRENFDRWMGLFGRLGEGVNRTHAAICGYRVATDVLGLTDKRQILLFTKDFVYKTQFAYGKQNLPAIITGAGNMRKVLRTMYTFRSYSLSYMQLLNSMMPWRGAPMRQTVRALGTLVVQAGVMGLPLAGLIGLAYQQMIGRTLEHDLREAMDEVGIPHKVIDMSLHGMYSPLGVDATNLVGVGDLVPTWGSTIEKIGGAPVGMAMQGVRAIQFAMIGEYERAMENANPDAIKSILKTYRYAKEGVRTRSKELIATPSKLDLILTSLGLPSLHISKAYAARASIQAMEKWVRAKSSRYVTRIADALEAHDHKKLKAIWNELSEYNKRVPVEKRIIPSTSAILDELKKRKGIMSTPLKIMPSARKTRKLFDLKEAK